MKKFYTLLLSSIFVFGSFAQTSNEFWFAPPEITSGHGSAASQGLRLVFANTAAVAATVTIEQPADPTFNGGTPIVIVIPANSGHIEDITAYRDSLETKPQDVVLNTGLHISSTELITCYYEVTTTYNPDIFALKGVNGLGTEFYTPFQNTWRNGGYTPTPYTSFDIVATEDNTIVLIYPRVPLDGGHPALSSYSVTLMRGQTYSGAVTSTVGANNPAGTAIVSNKPIAVSIKDDSVWPEPAGCKDLNGDQLVPVDIVGNDYIATRGGLTAPEYVYLVSTQNNNVIMVDGIAVATLFAGETYRIQMSTPTSYISCSQPTYCYHLSGFGCETGGALLPPLNCAGSSQVNVVRSTTEPFSLNIVVPTGAEGGFQLNGNTTLISGGAFLPVPNSGGAWMYAQITFNTTDVPVGQNNLITNSIDVFSVGLINGGGGTGTRFGYFSEFNGKIDISAGGNQTVCSNDSVTLVGSVSGATVTGQWSTSGTGFFLPDDVTLNAIYVPSVADLGGDVDITLTSTGACTPASNVAKITFTPAPIVDAGSDIVACKNNVSVTLSGSVTGSTTVGVWSGGTGTYNPNPNTLNAVYTPSAAEIAAGTVTLTLTSIYGTCNPESDDVKITYIAAPTVDAGIAQSICSNNPNVTLAGSITIATSATWSGGLGTFSPNVNALNAVYTPTPSEIALGSLTLTLTTTPTLGPGICTSESDNVTITFTPSPTVDAGLPQSVCANNSAITLNGTMTVATGGIWTGGAGTYVPNANALNAVYTPSAAEATAGKVKLTYLTTTGLGNCAAVNDSVTMTITPAPVVEAGPALISCANNPSVTLAGSVTLASGGTWSGGSGSYNPDAGTLNAVYTPSAGEIAAGLAKLYLTSNAYSNCLTVTDSVFITINPKPTVDAGIDQTICVDNLMVSLAGSISGNTNTGRWTTSGSGSFIPNDTTLNATYKVSSGDSLIGSVTLTLSSTNSLYCLPVSEDMTITILPAGLSNAGLDQTVCANNANVVLNGAISGGATKGKWTTTGTGAFTPNDTTLNATYLPSAFDKTNGLVTLILTANSCNLAVSQIDVTITPKPLVYAGLDQTICATNLSIPLVGSVTGASTTGKWTTLGSGTFDNDLSMTPIYNASAGDSLLQGVDLILTATNIGNCASVSDTVHINIYPTGGVIAGNDQTLCANNGNVNLSGVITGGASTGKWTTSGSGVFTPNDTALNAIYIPSSSDTANGIVNLILTATNSCNVAADFLIVNFSPAPVAIAGNDDVICATNPNYTLNGSFIGSSGSEWTTSGTGIFSPSKTAVNATYIPTAADILAGSVTLKLTTTGNGTCNAVSDSLLLTYSPGVKVNAGQDQSVCSSSGFTILQGVVSSGSTTGIWTTTGTGTFVPDSANLGAEYHFSAGDLLVGSVKLLLTSSNNGTCIAETDTMEIVFGSTAYTDAGADQTVCVSNMDVVLNGFVAGGATTGKWFTNGSGTFSPNDTTLNATYTPSAMDSVNGTLELRLVSTNNGGCTQGADTMMVTIEANPIVDAGTDIVICASVDSLNLLGVVSTSRGKWSTTGSGLFVPNDTILSAIYVPSLSDIAVGSWNLILTSVGNVICNVSTDTLQVNVVDALDAAFIYTESCIGKPMSFKDSTVVNQGTISNWKWSFGDGNTSTSQNPFNTFTTVGPYDVKLVVTSSLGCKDSIITSILINTPPVANFVFEGTLSVDDPVQFTDASSIDVVNWKWDFGDGNTSTDQNPTQTYLRDGNFDIELIVNNQYGCSDTIVKSIEITNEVVYRPVTPTAFSPNGDGENDVLYIRGGPFLELYWAVYNQWGNLIFEGFTDQDGWDGKWKGKIQPNTDYIVVIRAVTVDGVKYDESNSISLIR